MKEYILCAAIWFDDKNKYPHQPKGIETGIVFCGHRHSSIFIQLRATLKEGEKLRMKEREQGFLTSQNRFVNRQDAAKIAQEAEQTIGKGRHITTLYSEDLY